MQRQIELAASRVVVRQRSAPVSRYWFQKNRRWLGDVGTIVLLLAVLWAVQDRGLVYLVLAVPPPIALHKPSNYKPCPLAVLAQRYNDSAQVPRFPIGRIAATVARFHLGFGRSFHKGSNALFLLCWGFTKQLNP